MVAFVVALILFPRIVAPYVFAPLWLSGARFLYGLTG
jgi:hypothetical protein